MQIGKLKPFLEVVITLLRAKGYGIVKIEGAIKGHTVSLCVRRNDTTNYIAFHRDGALCNLLCRDATTLTAAIRGLDSTTIPDRGQFLFDNVPYLNIAKHFTSTPGPRYKKLGDYSGEEFRETCLMPLLEISARVNTLAIVDLRGIIGLPIGFSSEAFGDPSTKNYLKNLMFFSDLEDYGYEIYNSVTEEGE